MANIFHNLAFPLAITAALTAQPQGTPPRLNLLVDTRPTLTNHQFQNIPVPRVSSFVATVSQPQGTAPRLNLLKDKIYAGVGQVPSYDWPNPNLPARPHFVAITAQPQGTSPRLNLLKDKMYGPAGMVADYDWPNPILRPSSVVATISQVLGVPLPLQPGQLPVGAISYALPVLPTSAVVAINAQPFGTRPRLNLLVDKIYAGPGQVPSYDWPNPNLRVSSHATIATTSPSGSFAPLLRAGVLTGANGNTYGQAFVADRTYLNSQRLGGPAATLQSLYAPLKISITAQQFVADRTYLNSQRLGIATVLQPQVLVPLRPFDWTNPVRLRSDVALSAQPLGVPIPYQPLIPVPLRPFDWTNPVRLRSDVAVTAQPNGVPLILQPPIVLPQAPAKWANPVIVYSAVPLSAQPLGRYGNLIGIPPASANWVGVPLEIRSVDTQPLGIPRSFTPPTPPPIVNLPWVGKSQEPPYVALFSQPLGTWFNIEGCKVPYTPVPCPPGQYSAIANPSGSYSQVDCPPPNYTPVKTTC